jgi:hypothetical protein
MRALALLVVMGCAHQAPAPEPAQADVVAGQLMVGTEQPLESGGVLDAVALDGYRFEYAGAASATSHLVKVMLADGSALSVEQTRELAGRLQGRPGLKYVELNGVRQMR